jgi:hypothetical protein
MIVQRLALREACEAIPLAAAELESGADASVACLVGRLHGAALSEVPPSKSSSTLAAPTGQPPPASGGLSSRAAAPISSKPAAAAVAKGGGKTGTSGVPAQQAPLSIESSEPPLVIPSQWQLLSDPLLACGLPTSEMTAACGGGASLAAASALQALLHEENVRVVAELWARAAHAAGVIALGSTPGTDSDRALLSIAQRSAAACLALVPRSDLARDELGGVFGLRGHGYASYGLPFDSGGKAASGAAVGDRPFRASFPPTPGGGVVTGSGRGGHASVFQWWSIAEVAWGRSVLLLIDPGSQSVSERDEVSEHKYIDEFVCAYCIFVCLCEP